MTAREMITRLRSALNKVDSRKYENLRIPALDAALNDAVITFVKFVAQPRLARQMGYESSGRSIHDIRTLVREYESIPIPNTDGISSTLSLPEDFLFYAKCRSTIKKGECTKNVLCTYVDLDDDENDKLYESSFTWNVLNVRLNDKGLVFLHNGSFIVSTSRLSYLKQPAYVHNAQDYGDGTYTTGGGVVLTGSQDCELPDHTHVEIVRLAALLLSGDLQMPDYQVKQANYQLSIQ